MTERFDSDEEFIAALRESRESVVNRPLAAEQEAIGWGAHAVRFMDSLVVFAYVLDLPTLRAQEDREVVDNLALAHNDGFMWCMCYSTRVPDGEYGSLHRSVLWPLTDRTFTACRTAGWDINALPQWVTDSMKFAYDGYRNYVAENYR